MREIVARLDATFHEPARLTIMLQLRLSGSTPFTTLKAACGLTDGNLNRHLNVLRQHGSVTIRKAVGKLKPRTSVIMTKRGEQEFTLYLSCLKEIAHLKQAPALLLSKHTATADADAQPDEARPRPLPPSPLSGGPISDNPRIHYDSSFARRRHDLDMGEE